MARTLLMALTTAFFAVPVAAPAFAAPPECTDTALNTRICERPGHTAISTTPNPALANPGWGFGWGTPIFGLGAGGIWIGI